MFAFKKGSAVDSWTIQIWFVNLRPKVATNFKDKILWKLYTKVNTIYVYMLDKYEK